MDSRKQIEWLVKNCAEPFKDGLNNGMNDAGRWGVQLIHGGFLSDTIVKKILGIKSPSEENRRHFSNMYSSIKNVKKNNNKKTRLRQ